MRQGSKVRASLNRHEKRREARGKSMKGKNLRSLLQCLGIKFSVIARVFCADVKRRETKELYSMRSPFCCRQRNQRNVNEIFSSSLAGSLDFPNFNIVKQLSYIEWKSCVSQILVFLVQSHQYTFVTSFYSHNREILYANFPVYQPASRKIKVQEKLIGVQST